MKCIDASYVSCYKNFQEIYHLYIRQEIASAISSLKIWINDLSKHTKCLLFWSKAKKK